MRFVILALLLTVPGFGQTTLEDYVLKGASAVKSIDINDTAYSDLAQLGAAIGGSRVVMLGEMWHGDGSTFEAKSRIVRYLHESQGFNILAFEGDFYALEKSMQKINAGQISLDSAVSANVYDYWSASKQCAPLFAYLRNNPSMQLAGIDCQLSGAISREELKAEIAGYLNGSGIAFLRSPYYTDHFWNHFTSGLKLFTGRSWQNDPRFNSALLKDLNLALDTVIDQLKGGKSGASFQHQTLLNYKELCNMYSNISDPPVAATIRDRQMAANLSWLLKQRYPNEKIIVWLASSHMVRDNQDAYQTPEKEMPMGYFYSQDRSNPPAFALAFIAHEGKGNALNGAKYKIEKTQAQSFERAFQKLASPYLFLSLKNYPSDNAEFVYAKVDGGNNLRARWQRCIDGLFYIRTMKPSIHK